MKITALRKGLSISSRRKLLTAVAAALAIGPAVLAQSEHTLMRDRNGVAVPDLKLPFSDPPQPFEIP
jgi:hypothetical protein